MNKIFALAAASLIAYCTFTLAFMPSANAAQGNQSVVQVGVPQGGQTSNAVTSSAAQVIGSNVSRAYLFIQNTGANSAIIKFGATFSGSEGITIPANGTYSPNPVPTNSIWAKSASGTTLNVVEGNL